MLFRSDSETLFSVEGTGSLKFKLSDGSLLTLNDVQYVPACEKNLISISQATLRGAQFLFLQHTVQESVLGKVATLAGPPQDQLYKFILEPVPAIRSLTMGTVLLANNHCRLGHTSTVVESRVAKRYSLYASSIKDPSNSLCEACARGKAISSRPAASTTHSTPVKHPLELVHSDVCGPFSHPSLTGDNYFVVLIDDFTHFMKSILSRANLMCLTLCRLSS